MLDRENRLIFYDAWRCALRTSPRADASTTGAASIRKRKFQVSRVDPHPTLKENVDGQIRLTRFFGGDAELTYELSNADGSAPAVSALDQPKALTGAHGASWAPQDCGQLPKPEFHQEVPRAEETMRELLWERALKRRESTGSV
jgi:hypothetical protein